MNLHRLYLFRARLQKWRNDAVSGAAACSPDANLSENMDFGQLNPCVRTDLRLALNRYMQTRLRKNVG